MSIQLVYNWRHRLVGWKNTEDREKERERDHGKFMTLGSSHCQTARYNYFTLGILFSFVENSALKFCSQD